MWVCVSEKNYYPLASARYVENNLELGYGSKAWDYRLAALGAGVAAWSYISYYLAAANRRC